MPSIPSSGVFAGLDPTALNREALKASAVASYLDGMVNSSTVAPSSQAALTALVTQDAPTDETVVNTWIASVDPSTIPAVSITPRYECTDEYQCPYSTTCVNTGPWSTRAPYRCWVTDCGASSCTICPEWFPDTLKASTIKAWCAYVCTDQSVPPNAVAVGAVGISRFGLLPAKGAWCFDP